MKNKKKPLIFGKINIADFIVIVVILIAAAVLVIKLSSGSVSPKGDTRDTARITLFVPSSPVYVSPHTQVGDDIYDTTTHSVLGSVASITTGQSTTYMFESGEYDTLVKDGYESVTITFEMKCSANYYGVMLDNNQYAVGQTLSFYAGQGEYYGRISNIEIIETAASAAE